MDELNGYFTRHPLENPANYRGTAYDPIGAARHRRDLLAWRERRAAPRRVAAMVQAHATGAAGRFIAGTP